ncbi:unnamed protein product [Schistosoma rodhaini]|uniref:C2H2-type domain-containing protein n=1 Tax=Schistosoma rodhaini TaxID=6188 RepID=A0AA85FPL7_9TREM|nr:unnamed protein product [Schistosoma rodhaini]
MFNNHLDHHSDCYDQNNNDHDRKDDYQVNIIQNYSEQYYYNIQSFIPPPLLLFTWSKLMRTELFQKTLQNVILSNSNYVITSLQSTNSPVNNNNNNSNGNNNNGNDTNPDLIDLTNRNVLIKRCLVKLNSLLFEYLSSNKYWASLSASAYPSPSSSSSLSSTTSNIEPYHQFNVYNNYESINCNNLHDNTLINHIKHESNHLNDNLPLEEATIQFNENKEIYSNHQSNNNNNSDFLIDSSHHLDSYMTSFNVPEIDHTKCNPYWSDLCIENYHPEIYHNTLSKNDPIWKQTSPPSPSSPSSSSSPTTTTATAPIIDYSFNTEHSIMNSLLISLNKTQLQSTSNPLTPYLPSLNLNEFLIDQNIFCPLCHKCFRFEKNLLRHLQKIHSTNTGESLLKCKLCNYTTKHYSNMYVHIRTHTGDKPYSCSACGVTFTQGSSLKLHIRSRHNDNIQYFSLIRKSNKNNLTKLWTRILKKDLPKLKSFNSSSSTSSSSSTCSPSSFCSSFCSSSSSSSSSFSSSSYHHDFWNKWRHSLNIDLNHFIQTKYNQYKNQFNYLSIINNKNIKKLIKSNYYWKSINSYFKINIHKKLMNNHHHHHQKYLNNIRSINDDLKLKYQIIDPPPSSSPPLPPLLPSLSPPTHHHHHDYDYNIDKIKLNEQLIKQEEIDMK